ncbi:hypothetical protein COLO4_15261 [Corchorus olitorius]|uniref:Uncharacterized protein n=1 Tax=Corchorus olitorius TaxID=93759 RepID=A0A1R3JNI2_9ROSI|nr:hypothetical protein COLO4_15261 [Corchorus olitorius]
MNFEQLLKHVECDDAADFAEKHAGSKFKLEDIRINSYDQISLSHVPTNPLKLHQLLDEQAKFKIYEEPLDCLRAIIVEMCDHEVKRMPKDLAHLMLYLKDFETFWSNDDDALTNAIHRAYPEGFVWKDVFSSHFIDNYPINPFKDAAFTLFSSLTLEDDGMGLLMYLQKLLEHTREYSNLDTMVKTNKDLGYSYSSSKVLEVGSDKIRISGFLEM